MVYKPNNGDTVLVQLRSEAFNLIEKREVPSETEKFRALLEKPCTAQIGRLPLEHTKRSGRRTERVRDVVDAAHVDLGDGLMRWVPLRGLIILAEQEAMV